MRRSAIAIALLLLSTAADATMIIRRAGAALDTSHITFYANADSVTSGLAPQKGAGTITIGGSYTSATGQVGNGWDNNNSGNSGGRITFDTGSGNLNPAEGSAAFWIYIFESGAGSDGEIFYLTTSAPLLRLSSVSGTYSFSYKDVSVFGFSGMTQNAWNFVQVSWDSDGDKLGSHAAVKVNGVSAGTVSGSTGSDPSSSTGKIGSADGNGHDSIVDNFMVSNDPSIDLYPYRFITSAP